MARIELASEVGEDIECILDHLLKNEVDDAAARIGEIIQAISVLEGLGLRPAGERAPRVLVVLDRTEHAVWKSFRNLGTRVQIIIPEELNPYDVLVNDWIVFSEPTLAAAISRFSETATTQTATATTQDDAA